MLTSASSLTSYSFWSLSWPLASAVFGILPSLGLLLTVTLNLMFLDSVAFKSPTVQVMVLVDLS